METNRLRASKEMDFRILLDGSLITAGIGAMIWLGGLSATVSVQAKNVDDLKSDNRVLTTEVMNSQKEVLQRLSRIEALLKANP